MLVCTHTDKTLVLATHLKEEKPLGDVLDKLISHILGEELDSEFELHRNLLANVLCCHLCVCVCEAVLYICELNKYLLVELEPGSEAFAVHIL